MQNTFHYHDPQIASPRLLLQYIDRGIFQEALESLESLISDYEDLGRHAVSSGERPLSHIRPMF